MSKIQALLSKNANYIYHMLSVANCGYHNQYGNKYKEFHNQTDLDILKKWEHLITVRGGEHCGELYGICVTIPASFDEDYVQEYFKALIDSLENQHFDLNLKTYWKVYEITFGSYNISIDEKSLIDFYHSLVPFKDAIIDISKVLLHNYDIYVNKIWNEAKIEISKTVDELNDILKVGDYAIKWEDELNFKYQYDAFYAVICNSIINGPEAIDISENKDIFCITEDYTSIITLINHEFGIYILKDILKDTVAFKDLKYYDLLESLAEYFNIRITGGHHRFRWNQEYINYYQSLKEVNPNITVKEMFNKATELIGY